MFVKSGVGGQSMLAQERKMFQKPTTKDQGSPTKVIFFILLVRVFLGFEQKS